MFFSQSHDGCNGWLNQFAIIYYHYIPIVLLKITWFSLVLAGKKSLLFLKVVYCWSPAESWQSSCKVAQRDILKNALSERNVVGTIFKMAFYKNEINICMIYSTLKTKLVIPDYHTHNPSDVIPRIYHKYPQEVLSVTRTLQIPTKMVQLYNSSS